MRRRRTPVASDWGQKGAVPSFMGDPFSLNLPLGGRPHFSIDNLSQLRQECCAWFLARLGREKLGFCRHGRQPVRSLLITGHDPGYSDTVSVNLWHILWMRVLRYGCLLSWLLFVDRYRLLPISFKGCHERLAGVRPRARSNNLRLIEQVLEAFPRNVSLEGSLLPAAQAENSLSRNWWWKLLSGNELKVE